MIRGLLNTSHFFRHWKAELERKKRGKKARLLVAVLKCFWFKMLIQGIGMFVEVRKVLKTANSDKEFGLLSPLPPL